MTESITPELIRAELERVLASAPFANSQRSQKFLSYVVDATLKNVDESLKEFAIAVDVFERNVSYDPSVDATVRVEAGRLRTRLREYYADAGHNDPIILEMPKGAYRVNFIKNTLSTTPPAKAPEPVALQKPHWRRPVFLGALALLAVAVLGGTALILKRQGKPAPANNGEVVLAVLPFSNQTGVEDNSYLTEGITQTLIRQFSQLPNVRVISRMAADHISRLNATSEYGVGYLLSGALVRSPEGKLVLNAELSNARDGSVLASREYSPMRRTCGRSRRTSFRMS